jgi:hypothetical protein
VAKDFVSFVSGRVGRPSWMLISHASGSKSRCKCDRPANCDWRWKS